MPYVDRIGHDPSPFLNKMTPFLMSYRWYFGDGTYFLKLLVLAKYKILKGYVLKNYKQQ